MLHIYTVELRQIGSAPSVHVLNKEIESWQIAHPDMRVEAIIEIKTTYGMESTTSEPFVAAHFGYTTLLFTARDRDER